MISKKTLVFTCNTAFGIANFRSGVLCALKEKGHRVIVVAPPDSINEIRLKSIGVEFVPWFVSGKGVFIFSEIASILSLIKIYIKIHPSICFHFTIKAVIYGAIASKCTGHKFVSVITGLGYVFLNNSWISKVAQLLYRITLKFSSEIWFLNKDDQQVFYKLKLTSDIPSIILPGEGINLQLFSPENTISNNQNINYTFLLIARLLRDKGIYEFVEAARIVLRNNPNTRFQLLGEVGSDNPSSIGIDQVKNWCDEGIVEYLGVTNDVREAIGKADCIVLPSYREGIPRCLMEAAAMQKPLITTDVPGCKDVVINGKTGWLCKSKDENDLAKKMIMIINTPKDRLLNMGILGRELMKKCFDEKIVIDLYIKAVNRLI
ncbi:MAG: glycosyltransferase family 4 protein [Bacteroidetes bacterium]|nr:glycosyltransferase family 4 protein [Bacteroidota bacterium]